MNTLVRAFLWLTALTRRLSICALTGFLAGGVAGLMLLLLFINQNQALHFTTSEVWLVALELTLFCWLMILLLFCLFQRYTFSSVAAPAFINCFLTCLLTTFLVNQFDWFIVAWLVGMVAGILVGTLLCYINSLLKR
jgi:hypothetical protein